MQSGLPAYGVVFDAVYTPMVTRLLREAQAVGATPVSGVEMFVRQAAKQFELFTKLPGEMMLDWPSVPLCQNSRIEDCADGQICSLF